MKRFVVIIIAVAVALSFLIMGCMNDNKATPVKEKTVNENKPSGISPGLPVIGTIPASWGSLRSVIGGSRGDYTLFFEDSEGTIRKVDLVMQQKKGGMTVEEMMKAPWALTSETVIKRSN